METSSPVVRAHRVELERAKGACSALTQRCALLNAQTDKFSSNASTPNTSFMSDAGPTTPYVARSHGQPPLQMDVLGGSQADEYAVVSIEQLKLANVQRELEIAQQQRDAHDLIGQLTTQIDQIKQEHDQIMKERDAAAERCRRLVSLPLGELFEEQSTAMKTSLQKAEADRDLFYGENQSLLSRISELEAQLSELGNKYSSETEQRLALLEDVSLLRNQVSSLEQNINQLNSHIYQLKTENEAAVREAVLESTIKMNRMESEIESLRNEKEGAERRERRAQEGMKWAKERLTDLEEERNEERRETEKRLRDLEREMELVCGRERGLEREKEIIEVELRKEKEQSLRYTRNMDEKEREWSNEKERMECEVKEVKEENELMAGQIRQLEGILKEKEIEMEKFKRRHEEMWSSIEERYEQMMIEMRESAKENEGKLEKAKEDIARKCSVLESECAGWRAKWEEGQIEIERERREVEERCMVWESERTAMLQENLAMKDRIQMLDTRLTEQDYVIQSLQSDLAKSRVLIGQMESDKSAVSSDRQLELEREVEIRKQLEEELTEARGKMEDLKGRRQEAMKKTKCLEEEKEMLEGVVEVERTLRRAAECEIEKEREIKEGLERAVRETSEKKEGLERQVREMNEFVEVLRTEVEREKRDKVDETRHMGERCEEMERKIEEMNGEMAGLKEEVEGKKRQLGMIEERERMLTREKEETEVIMEKMTRDIREMTERIEVLQREKNEERNRWEEVEREKAGLESEIGKLNENIEKIERELVNERQVREGLEATLKVKTDKIEKMKIEMAELHAKSGILDGERVRLEGVLEEYETEKRKLEDDVVASQRARDEMEERMTGEREEKERAWSEREKERQERERLEGMLKQEREERVEARAAEERERKEKDRIEELLRNERGEKEKLTGDLERMTREWGTEKEEWKHEQDRLEGVYRQELEEKDTLTREVKTQKDRWAKERENLQGTLEREEKSRRDGEVECRTLRESLTELQEALSATATMRQSLESEKVQLAKDLAQTQTEKNTIACEKMRLETKIQALNTELMALRDAYETGENRRVQLEDELDRIEEEKAEEERKNRNLELEVERERVARNEGERREVELTARVEASEEKQRLVRERVAAMRNEIKEVRDTIEEFRKSVIDLTEETRKLARDWAQSEWARMAANQQLESMERAVSLAERDRDAAREGEDRQRALYETALADWSNRLEKVQSELAAKTTENLDLANTVSELSRNIKVAMQAEAASANKTAALQSRVQQAEEEVQNQRMRLEEAREEGRLAVMRLEALLAAERLKLSTMQPPSSERRKRHNLSPGSSLEAAALGLRPMESQTQSQPHETQSVIGQLSQQYSVDPSIGDGGLVGVDSVRANKRKAPEEVQSEFATKDTPQHQAKKRAPPQSAPPSRPPNMFATPEVAKRDRPSSKKSPRGPKYVVCFTGFKKDCPPYDLKTKDKMENWVRIMKGSVRSDSSFGAEITHVVAPPGVRTLKTLAAVLSNKWVMSPEWLTRSEKTGYFLPEGEYGVRRYERPFEGKRFYLDASFYADAGKLADSYCTLLEEIGRGSVAGTEDGPVDFVLVGRQATREMRDYPSVLFTATTVIVDWHELLAVIPQCEIGNTPSATPVRTRTRADGEENRPVNIPNIPSIPIVQKPANQNKAPKGTGGRKARRSAPH